MISELSFHTVLELPVSRPPSHTSRTLTAGFVKRKASGSPRRLPAQPAALRGRRNGRVSGSLSGAALEVQPFK